MELAHKLRAATQSFILSEFSIDLHSNHEVAMQFEKMNGLSNDIYLIKLVSHEKTAAEFIFRQFGHISDLVDRNLEASIIHSLSGPGFAPKIFETDNKTYRIEEYIKDANELRKEQLLNPEILTKVVKILDSYTKISNVHTFYIQNEKIEIDVDVDSNEYKSERINQNIFDLCTGNMLHKALGNFAKFSESFYGANSQVDAAFNKNFETIKTQIESYQHDFNCVFPKNSLFVLNHNDVHRLNILQKFSDELMILDHEYACLNLIGVDIVNYMIESCFDYTTKQFPFYEFNRANLNFENFFEVFLKFLDEFELSHAEDLKNENFQKKFQQIKGSYSYFLKLVCVISLFWFLYSVIYLDLEKLKQRKNFDYMQHAMDRLHFYALAKNELRKM